MLVQSILNTVNTCSSSDSRAGAEFIILIMLDIYLFCHLALPAHTAQEVSAGSIIVLLCYYLLSTYHIALFIT